MNAVWREGRVHAVVVADFIEEHFAQGITRLAVHSGRFLRRVRGGALLVHTHLIPFGRILLLRVFDHAPRIYAVVNTRRRIDDIVGAGSFAGHDPQFRLFPRDAVF